MLFSADGNYFITAGDDNTIIISDLRKRLPITRLENQQGDVLLAHPSQPFFFTSEKKGDTTVILKRSIPSGQVVQRTSLPNTLSAGIFLQSYNLIELDETGSFFLVAYQSFPNAVVATFDLNGKLINFSKGASQDQLNAIVKQGNSTWVSANNGLYRQQDSILQPVLKPATGEYFANMIVFGDSIILMSNRNITWYSIKQSKVLSRTNIQDFFSQGDGDNGGRIVRIHHPFIVDRTGAVYIINTRIPDLANDGVKLRPFALAKITNTISYPFLSTNRTSVARAGIEPLFTYNKAAGLFVVMERMDKLSFLDASNGYLFSLGRKNLPVKDLRFTATPGKLLLQVDDIRSPGFLLDLSTGRMETIGVMDDQLYSKPSNKQHYSSYKVQPSREHLYIPASKNYINAPYLLKDNTPILNYPFKDELKLPMRGNTNLIVNEKGVLQLVKDDGTMLKQLQLYALKDEDRDYVSDKKYVNGKYSKISWNDNHFISSYQYDSTTATLALSVDQYFSSNTTTTHFVDLNTFKLIKSYVSDKLGVLPASRSVINGYGIFSVENNSATSIFPNGYTFSSLFTPSQNEKKVFFIKSGYAEKDILYCWDVAEQKMYELGQQHGINKIICDPHSPLLYTLGQDESIMIWNSITRQQVAQIVISGKKDYDDLSDVDGSYLVLLNDGYYMGQNKYYQMLKLQDGTRSYSISDIDVLYHRPDKVLESLGYASTTLLQPLKELAEKRAKRTNINFNTADILIKSVANIPFYSSDPLQHIVAEIPKDAGDASGVMVYVNGTAIWNKAIPLKKDQSIFTADVALVDDVNHVRFCIVKNDGKETPGDFFYINSKAADNAEIYIIGIGVSKYKDTTYNLKYADKDMNDLLNYLYTTDTYSKNHIKRFSNQQVNKAIVDSIKWMLQKARSQDVVLCYYAGHGLLDKNNDYYLGTYDINFNDPAPNGLGIRQLNEAVAASAARKKMIFIDACHSGLIDDLATAADTLSGDAKGVVRRGFSIKGSQKASSVQYSFNHFNQGTGVDILAASAGNEYALELGAISNGVFTYSALQAFKSGEADYNNDKKLTLYELQQYVSNKTRQLTKGAQRPTFRQNNLYQDIVLLSAADSYVSRFMTAAKQNDVNTIKLLLDNKEVTIDQLDKEGFTALHYACRQGSFNVIKYLVENGADVHRTTTALASTPLYLAAWNDHYRAAYYLMTAGAIIDEDIQGWQMNEIVKKNHTPTINILRNYAAIKLQQDQLRTAALEIINGNINKADSLLIAAKLSVNGHLLIEGLPIVVMPIIGKNLQALEWIVGKGANINAASLDDSFTPLMFAANMGQMNIARWLLGHGADITAKDRFGQTAAQYAARAGFNELAELLR